MKDGFIVLGACVGIACLIASAAAFARKTAATQWRESAIYHGVGEYYLVGDKVHFRWKTNANESKP